MRPGKKKQFLQRSASAVHTIGSLHLPLHAAHAGYFIVLAVFPTLVLLLSLLRYTGFQVENLTELIGDFLPSALMESVEELVFSTYRNSTGENRKNDLSQRQTKEYRFGIVSYFSVDFYFQSKFLLNSFSFAMRISSSHTHLSARHLTLPFRLPPKYKQYLQLQSSSV